MADYDFTQDLNETKAKFDMIAKAVDMDALAASIKELEAEASAPGLWDDQEHA